jgi:hypothetical protein
VLRVERWRLLRGNDVERWCARENEAEQGNGLFVAAGGCAANDDDNGGRSDEPERNENFGHEIVRGGWHKRRNHDKRDAENGDGFTRSAHGTSPTSIRPWGL